MQNTFFTQTKVPKLNLNPSRILLDPYEKVMEGLLNHYPGWWEWELEISSHCQKRMSERSFSETDLRTMIEDAFSIEEQDHGTFIAKTSLHGVNWEVIVVPEHDRRVVIAVTAYPDT